MFSVRLATKATDCVTRRRCRPAPPKLTDFPGFAKLAKIMKQIYFASLVALVLFLAWHFNILLRLKRMLERMGDWPAW